MAQSSYHYHLFLSFNHADSEWVNTWLLPKLTSAGLRTLPGDRLPPGVPFVDNIAHAVEQSRHTLVVLSPDWVKSEWQHLEASLTHLRFPVNHRKGIRTSNSMERLFGEQRRRTKVIPRFFDEKSCLKLVFAALIRAARGFRPFAMNDLTLAQLESLRKEKKLPPAPSLDYELANQLREAA